MSKKQGMKKKVTVKVNPGQAIFVGDIEVFNHIIDTYLYMASSCEDPVESESWKSVSEDILSWVNETQYHGQVDDFEEEW